MKKVAFAGSLLAMVLTLPGFAAPPKTLKVIKSVDVQAPVDKAWAAIKDFDSLDKWHPGFSKDTLLKGTNNKPGAVRQLTVKDGPSFTEELLEFDAAHHSYRYRIVESPLPIDHYVSRISVKAGPNGTSRVTWSGTFKRKNTSDNPPEAENDAGAVKLVTGVYEGGLANLKKQFGS
ncbi:MAG TPA: SRPBCC family protein [Steroidobacteraceae bacterium]|jgi:mxaD protein